MANYGDVMAYLRNRADLTQEEAAKGIGISRSSLANYEKGLRRPSFEIMEAVADFYNVNMDTIFGHTELPSDYQFTSLPDTKPSVSTEDMELLELYHQLPEEHRDLILTQLRAIAKPRK